MPNKRNFQKVLVVEDEHNIRQFISRVLELEGYDVCHTGDGDYAMEIIRKDHVSLVLLDLSLAPERDGWSILREMKHDPNLSMIPVVVLTATAEAAQRRRTLRMGAARYLIKPISAQEITRNIRETLKSAGQSGPVRKSAFS